MTKNKVESFSPYCPECQACGHEGCCSPLMCKQSKDGDYCESYLEDLKFGYYMMEWVSKNIIETLPTDIKSRYDEEWDKAYDKFHKKVS